MKRNSLPGSSSIFYYPLLSVLLVLVVIGLISLFDIISSNRENSLVVFQFALVICAIVLVSWVFRRTRVLLITPLKDLLSWIQHIKDGDLTAQIPEPVSGEFAPIVKKVNLLGSSLKNQCQNMDKQVRLQTKRVEQMAQSLEILHDAATGINVLHDLNELLTRFLYTLSDLVHAKAAIVRLITDEDQMRLIASIGLTPTVEESERITPIARCLCGIALSNGIMLQDDIHKCGTFTDTPPFNNKKLFMLSIPLQYREKPLGVYNLFADNIELATSENIQHLCTSIGRHLGIAIERTRLENDARRLSIMEERTLMANELHDSLAQSLASLKFQVSMVEETVGQSRERTGIGQIRKIKLGLDEANSQLRELLSHFRTRMDERGLIPAIETSVERFNNETDITAFFQVDSKEFNLTPSMEVQILHIVQEALANVRKHSNAKNVRILFRSDESNHYLVLVEDDGKGISSTESKHNPGEHVGLSIMNERAKKLDGSLTIDSELGEGTRVELRFNMPNQSSENDDMAPFTGPNQHRN